MDEEISNRTLVECHCFINEAKRNFADKPEYSPNGPNGECKTIGGTYIVYQVIARAIIVVEGKKRETGMCFYECENKDEAEKILSAMRDVFNSVAEKSVTIALTLQRMGQLPIKKVPQRILGPDGNPVNVVPSKEISLPPGSWREKKRQRAMTKAEEKLVAQIKELCDESDLIDPT